MTCQQPAGDREPGGDRRVFVETIDHSAAPRIDGHLDDPAWSRAALLGALRQVEPYEAATPSQATVIRVLRDAHALYFAFECHDDDPRAIRATQRARDADLEPDDRIEWVLDTFGNGNLGYFMQIGAAGSIGDGLIANSGFTKSWDTIWRGRALVTASGWQAEVAIPFQSLAFAAGSRAWRFNVRRIRRSTNEEFRWASAERRLTFFRPQQLGGWLEGVGGAHPGLGLDVVPYVAYSRSRSRLADPAWRDDPDAGLDLFYRVRPALTAALTTFTDFAQTENDDRRINLTQFPLFFPEKRDFFLQDASRFAFGSGDRAVLPFFSRRIGIGPDGEVPIELGAKVAGQEGPWEIGFLGVQTGHGGGVDGRRELGVLRLNRDLGEETTLGAIATRGRPVERGDAATYGLDLFHRVPRIAGDQELRLWLWALGTETSGPGGDGQAGGIEVRGGGLEWDWTVESRWVGEQFNPELGFVRRVGSSTYSGSVEYEPRVDSDLIRNLSFELETRAVLDTGNDREELEVELTPFGLELHDGDRLGLRVERRFERVDRDFVLFDDVVVPAGGYWETRYSASIDLSEGRPLSGELRASVGDRFAGESWSASGEADWRVSPLLIVGLEFSETQARIGGRRFVADVAQAAIDLHPDPAVSLRTLAQWDNDSRNLAFQTRLRWIVRPGSDVFVVAGADWDRGADGALRPNQQGFAAKVAHTIRF